MEKKTNARGIIAYAHDIVMTAVSFAASAYLRLGNDVGTILEGQFLVGGLTLMVIGAFIYWYTGLYRGIWRYASVRDLTAIAKAATLTLLLFLLVMFVWSRLEALPRSLPFINWLVLMALLGGPRLAYRIARDRSFDLKDAPGGKRRIPVLLAGAGDGAELFIRALQGKSAEYRVVGILSEKPQRVGQQIHGVPIIDTLQHFDTAVARMAQRSEKPQRLILTRDDFDGAVVRRLLDQCTALGVTLGRMPKMTDFRSGTPDTVDIRPVDVEDLLGRPQTTLDKDAMRQFIAGKRILITGAGGSIGSELARQIAAFDPKKIGLLDSSEYGLYQIDREVSESHPDLPRFSIIADVRQMGRVDQVISDFKPEIVFHAAALKHVPLVEENCCEGVATNVLGTVNMANACVRHNVSTMVQISTDKAINPTNVMGATKRVAEQYCQALDIDRGEKDGTKFVTVRFGNVLGSTGSVVPLFQNQLANGGPLTVTHPDMTRYFMTVREAVELVLLASAKARPGIKQDGKIFVLDMGEPVRIMDLAEQMIRLAGFEPGNGINIEITGCRPGEKLYEEIFHDSEEIVRTDHEGILLAEPRTSPLKEIKSGLKKLTSACEKQDEIAARHILAKLVPEALLERL